MAHFHPNGERAASVVPLGHRSALDVLRPEPIHSFAVKRFVLDRLKSPGTSRNNDGRCHGGNDADYYLVGNRVIFVAGCV